MDREYLKRVIVFTASSLLAVLAIIYIVRAIVDIYSVDMEVAAVQSTEWDDTVTVSGTIFRNEQLLYSDVGGSVNHLYDDGTRVSANTTVATVYNSTADSTEAQIVKIDRKIKILEKSNGAENTSDTSYIDGKISKLYYLIRLKTEQGDLQYVEKKTEELLVLLNQRKIIINARLDYNTELAELRAKRETLLAGSENTLDSVKTKVSGYYSSQLYGYENILTASALDGISLSGLKELTGKSAEALTKTDDGYAVGKISTDAYWYICVLTDKQTAELMTKGNTYKIAFPACADEELKFTLTGVLKEKGSEEYGLIFKTDELPADFTYRRTQTVTITFNTVSGLRVPTSAVRVLDGKIGVYILKDNITTFREIDILLRKEGYYIVKAYDREDEGYGTALHLYDSVVTQGKGISEQYKPATDAASDSASPTTAAETEVVTDVITDAETEKIPETSAE